MLVAHLYTSRYYALPYYQHSSRRGRVPLGQLGAGGIPSFNKVAQETRDIVDRYLQLIAADVVAIQEGNHSLTRSVDSICAGEAEEAPLLNARGEFSYAQAENLRIGGALKNCIVLPPPSAVNPIVGLSVDTSRSVSFDGIVTKTGGTLAPTDTLDLNLQKDVPRAAAGALLRLSGSCLVLALNGPSA